MIIMGLGNKGVKYSETRHNVGFDVLNRLHRDIWLPADDYEFSTYKDDHLVVKPMVGMNNSGVVAWYLLSIFEKYPSDLILVHDDMDIELGRIKIKFDGGDGHHNGVKSVIDDCNSKKFIRVRVGIGRPPSSKEGIDFVLSKFNKHERELVNIGIKTAATAINQILSSGVQSAMSVFNRKM